jgi:hypothetical protein
MIIHKGKKCVRNHKNQMTIIIVKEVEEEKLKIIGER